MVNFPTTLDSLTNPLDADPMNAPNHADQHSEANDILELLEAKVGVDSSSVTTSHDYLISQLQITEHTHVWNETPTGTINGSNTAFTLANSPSPAGSLLVFLNGILQRSGASNDFTLSGAVITFGAAPMTNSEIVCSYVV